MSRKQVLAPQYVTTSAVGPEKASQSLAASFVTAATEVSFQDNIGYQINITTSDSTGTFRLEGSNDNLNWFTMLSPAGIVSAANDVVGINVNQIPFKLIRLGYDSTVAGTGFAEIILMARTVGA